VTHWSTEDMHPHDRFDHWCEVRARHLFGVTISLPPEERRIFHGRFSAVGIGGATLSEMQASAYTVTRGAADIERAPSDSLCLYQQVSGASWFDSGAGEFLVPAGGLAISHSDMPYLTAPATGFGFDLRVLKIPLAGRDLPSSRIRGLRPVLQRADQRFARLLAAAFAALVAGAIEDDPRRAIDHLAQLALLARGCVTAGSPESRAAIRFGLLQAARAIIHRDLRRPELAPSSVAVELGVSVRQIHLLFEPTGRSFARSLLALRLAEARHQVETMAPRPVADIALACGFDSLSTFYRVFRQAHGMTATDLRDQMAQARSDGLAATSPDQATALVR
jgi:AraC-like DNA-binding protein